MGSRAAAGDPGDGRVPVNDPEAFVRFGLSGKSAYGVEIRRLARVVSAWAIQVLGMLLVASPVEAATPTPPAPEPDWLAIAEARGRAGLYAARDVSARKALLQAPEQADKLEALKLLADTAARTGDWTSFDETLPWPWRAGTTDPEPSLPWPSPPGPDCQCDELAWRVAVQHARRGQPQTALAWLAVVRPDSPAWSEAQLARVEVWGFRTPEEEDLATLEALVQTRPRGERAIAIYERALMALAHRRCTSAGYAGALALLDRLPQARPEVAVARAWCAIDAGRAEDVSALLPALNTAERRGAWLPSLPLLRVVAARTGGDVAEERRMIEAARTTYTAHWGVLSGTAGTLARNARWMRSPWASPAANDLWRLVLDPRGGLPSGVVARLRSNNAVIGLQARIKRLDEERGMGADVEVRAEIDAERTSASRRVTAALRGLLDVQAWEMGWLLEQVEALEFSVGATPPGPAAEELSRLTAESVTVLRGILASTTSGPYALSSKEHGELYTRLADLEMGVVPTDRTIETLYTALFAKEFRYREHAAWTLSLLLIDAGRAEEAETTLRALKGVTPQSPIQWKAVVVLGELAFARKDFVSAEEAYRTAAASPDRTLALYATYRRAWCAWALGRPSEASTWIAEVIADPATSDDLRRHARDEQALLGTCRPTLRCAGGR